MDGWFHGTGANPIVAEGFGLRINGVFFNGRCFDPWTFVTAWKTSPSKRTCEGSVNTVDEWKSSPKVRKLPKKEACGERIRLRNGVKGPQKSRACTEEKSGPGVLGDQTDFRKAKGGEDRFSTKEKMLTRKKYRAMIALGRIKDGGQLGKKKLLL